MKRIWGMPTLEIHGVVGGYQGPGLKSIVPPRGGSESFVPVGAGTGSGEDQED